MILIVSSEQDDHARLVIRKLQEDDIEFYLLDLSRFPRDRTLCMKYSNENGSEDSWIGEQRDTIPLSRCSVVWWRRPQPFGLHPDLVDPVAINFAYDECSSALSGLWLTVNAMWVNHPTRDEEAGRKPYQLKIAHEAGLEIPKTCITSDPEKAREFANSIGIDQTIYKAFSGTPEAWRETRVLRDEELVLLENVRYSPVIFQEYIPVQLDLRVTVIGDTIFASAIYPTKASYRPDYRMGLNGSPVKAFSLPDEVARKIGVFMQKLGLIYGAIDMRLTPDGRFVFLEVNPAGQWLFMEHRTGQPMTAAFVRFLKEHDE